MIETYKGRELKEGQKVKVYYNLHKKCYSLQDAKSGLVLAHLDNVILQDVTFKVSESGRQRVLQEKRKNVHAFIIGYFSKGNTHINIEGLKKVTYNPYKYETFVRAETEEKIEESELMYLASKQAYIL